MSFFILKGPFAMPILCFHDRLMQFISLELMMSMGLSIKLFRSMARKRLHMTKQMLRPSHSGSFMMRGEVFLHHQWWWNG
jgi:hypothetical protein